MTVNELLGLSGESFIRAAYRAILGRDADETGLQHYLERLDRGDKRSSVLSHLVNSNEANARASHQDLAQVPAEIFIDVIYQRVLGRAPDPVGRENYLAALRMHGDRQRIIQDIEASAEARRRNGQSAQFKEDLLSLLREEGEWPVTLDDLMSQSGEAFVRKAYVVILGRDPDEVGLRHYLKRLEHGVGRAGVLEDLLRSEEAKRYATHHDLDLMSNGEFLDVIYKRLLGRSADEQGKRHYLTRLEKGGKRTRIVKSMENSSEGRIRKSRVREFRRDLRDLLSEDRRARSWWRFLGRGTWVHRRMNQIEYQLALTTERLNTLVKLGQQSARFRFGGHHASETPIPQRPAPGSTEEDKLRSSRLGESEATMVRMPVSAVIKEEPESKPSIFSLLNTIPIDEPSAFMRALADGIASSKEAEAFSEANERSGARVRQ